MMDETAVTTDLDDSVEYNYDSFDEQTDDRPAERWAPLGAAANSPVPGAAAEADHIEQLEKLEEEQEQLNSSLLALTTHFAQVQFRLKQIVSADADDKEVLLKELEQFAFKGIPDVRGTAVHEAQSLHENLMSDREHELKISEQREKQQELIKQLKTQLEDLETYAYETGEAELPTNKMMEKQKVVIDELRNKLDLDLDNYQKLSTEELRLVVERAVGQIVNPAKVKEKLVDQLKTQITDLERFIDFLQDNEDGGLYIDGEASSPGPLGKERCTCPVHRFGDDGSDHGKDCCVAPQGGRPSLKDSKAKAKNIRETTAFMRRTITVLQMFLLSQFGCGSRDFQRNVLKKTTKGNHWGDLRARLEVAVAKVADLAKEQQDEKDLKQESTEEYGSDSEESQEQSSPALTQVVRKDLSMAIRDLMQHGLMEIGQSTSVVPFGCMPNRSAAVTKQMHAWDLLLRFYEMKHGREYNDSPFRKLSQSFHLDIVGGKPITAKQTLLGAIDTVITSHTPLKRTEDSHFKAFISLALNERKLSTWLKLLFRTQTLIDQYYQDWSYVARTSFDDSLKSMDRLSKLNFQLPVDLAVRPFCNIKDAF